ncbi:MAG: Unknown protein [uncultured Sulfurovum sp.]|uniref:Uncharacterized protein n=1 Tax=uncultured Sulfurovum sp. TaxID=269237 RepID=A0A6S6SZX8_9BACT|nr:MAG: Unknown protein [uncultured Sulfurovum sp.]
MGDEEFVEIKDKDSKYLPFKEARKFVHKLKLQKRKDWKKYCNGEYKDKVSLPLDIPKNPYNIYSNKGWKHTEDWIGIEKKHDCIDIKVSKEIELEKERYLPFEEAIEFVHKYIKLSSREEWKGYCIASTLYKSPSAISLKNNIKKPIAIPSHPEEVYKSKGWIDYNNWLGLKVEKYLPFKEAREFVHKLKLQKRKDWKKYCSGEYKDKTSLPLNIPKEPHTIYLNKGWKHTEDWIGIERKMLIKKGKIDKGIEIPDYGGL